MISAFLPSVNPDTRAFWSGGLEGRLMICRCGGCGHYIHPPQPVCPACWGRSTAAEAVSGRGRLHSFSINHQPWIAGQTVPFAFIAVELDEQPGLILMSRLEGDHEGLAIGEPLEAVFAVRGDVALPLFRRAGAGT